MARNGCEHSELTDVHMETWKSEYKLLNLMVLAVLSTQESQSWEDLRQFVFEEDQKVEPLDYIFNVGSDEFRDQIKDILLGKKGVFDHLTEEDVDQQINKIIRWLSKKEVENLEKHSSSKSGSSRTKPTHSYLPRAKGKRRQGSRTDSADTRRTSRPDIRNAQMIDSEAAARAEERSEAIINWLRMYGRINEYSFRPKSAKPKKQ